MALFSFCWSSAFSPFPACFQKTFLAWSVCLFVSLFVWGFTLYQQYFSYSTATVHENEQFLLFPVFSTCLKSFLLFSTNLKLLSANSFNLDESKNLSFGKGLNSKLFHKVELSKLYKLTFM